MTLTNQTSSITLNGNGITTHWPYPFIIPDDASARVGLFDIATSALTPIPDTDYSISGIGNDAGGEVVYPLASLPISAAKRIVIWREVEYTQDTELTNQTPYYPVVLMDQLDRMVMQTQQLAEESSRSLKVTQGANLDPDAFIAQLQQGAADAEAAAEDAEDAAIAAAASASAAAASVVGAVKYNAVQTQTAAEQGQARANIGAGVMAGFRNKIINGNGRIGQRGTVTSSGATPVYGSDRWQFFGQAGGAGVGDLRSLDGVGGSGSENIPQHASSCIYWRQTTPTAGSGVTGLSQPIEDVRTLAAKKATVTFWARQTQGPGTLGVLLQQMFGIGGSAPVNTAPQNVVLTGTWQRFSLVFDLPEVQSKTIVDGNYLLLNFIQSGAVIADNFITCVSLVEGDATAEADPFSPRHIQQELALCQRYYETGETTGHHLGTVTGAVYLNVPFKVQKRSSPTVVRTGDGVVSPGTAGTTVALSSPDSFYFTKVSSAVLGGAWTADAEI